MGGRWGDPVVVVVGSGDGTKLVLPIPSYPAKVVESFEASKLWAVCLIRSPNCPRLHPRRSLADWHIEIDGVGEPLLSPKLMSSMEVPRLAISTF